jgi:aquaporin PIP
MESDTAGSGNGSSTTSAASNSLPPVAPAPAPPTPLREDPTAPPSFSDVRRDFAVLFAKRLFPTRERLRAWWDECTSLQFAQACLAEFFGMALLLFAVTVSIVYSFPESNANPANDSSFNSSAIPRTVLISAVFGLTIAVLVFSLSTSSGGHLNPAVSFALLLRGAISLPRFVAYTSMQIAGACAGSAYTRSLNPILYDSLVGPDGARAAACNRINYELFPGVSVWTAFGAEMLATTILIWSVLASGDVGTLPQTRRSGALNPLSIGLAVFLAHLALMPIDGTSINPARSFGTAATAGFWVDQWLFWVAPLTGSAIACVTYELFFFGRRSHPLVEVTATAEETTSMLGRPEGGKAVHARSGTMDLRMNMGSDDGSDL